MAGATNKKMNAEDRAVCEEFNVKADGYRRKIEKKQSAFDLRTETMRTDEGKPKKGRLYSTEYASKNGGLRVDEMIYGLKMAHLSVTDDTDERLVGSSANALAALELAVGGDTPKETMKLPLSQILKEHYDLNLDCMIDESGMRKARAVDTQGFIASNDEMIVLSYRFSTSIFDWLANLSMTSSEWEVHKDEALGHAGVFSSARGWFTKFCGPRHKSKPRVHTAYYNNFIYTVPMIRKHIIEPLLKDLESDDKDIKPKKIYVVGCSLGAAVSQIAYCFILETLFPYLSKPECKIVDRLISVTAGSPRVGDRKFRDSIMKKMETLRELDRAVICRLVFNHDIVPHAPPNILNFHHLDKVVYFTKGGKNCIVNPCLSKRFTKFGEIKTIYSTLFQKKKKDFDKKKDAATENMRKRFSVVSHDTDVAANADSGAIVQSETKAIAVAETGPAEEEEKTAFQLECESYPEVIHDHMPYWYMTALEKIKNEQDALYKNDVVETIAEA